MMMMMMVLMREMWRGGRHADNCPTPGLTADGSLEEGDKENGRKRKCNFIFGEWDYEGSHKNLGDDFLIFYL